MTRTERLRDKANSLPMQPGVYIMKGSDGRIIYVGKSKKLKNRVTSYFSSNTHTAKTEKMVSLVHDFDYIVCDTEIEALTLENVLIKKHSPRYNIKLKDAKSYPYVKVTAEEYPRLYITRDRRSGKGAYFGPYSGSAAAHAALDTVVRIFALPTCKRAFPRDIGRERPCIYFDMGRCCGVCTGKVGAEDYRERVRRAQRVLDGHITEVRSELKSEMERAAEELMFERAAGLRDSIRALEHLSEKQKVVADAGVNRDVIAIYTSDTEGAIAILSIRDGTLINKNEFILSSSQLSSADDAVALIADYYEDTGSIPREIMLDFDLEGEELELLSEYLGILAKHKVTVRIPERGEGRRLCDMALENAAEAARQYRLEGEREDKGVKRLTELLGLEHVPARIEAYDISNIGKEHITASMVVWADGRLKKSDYRVFGIKSTDGVDDYASMREAVGRRLAHIGDGSASLSCTPDLILLDGGAGHVGVIKDLLAAINEEIPVFGMVKDDFHKTRAITDGEREISIAQETAAYTFVYGLQEEAHRFAVKHSTGAKTRTLTHSSLEKIEGIGPAKAKALLAAMPLSVIREADVESLARVKGISDTDAKKIYAYFKEKREVGSRKKNEKNRKEEK